MFMKSTTKHESAKIILVMFALGMHIYNIYAEKADYFHEHTDLPTLTHIFDPVIFVLLKECGDE